MRPDKDILADHHLAISLFPPLPPMEMGEYRGSKPYRAVIPYRHCLRVQFIDVYKLADPDPLPNSGSPRLVEPGPQGIPTGDNVSQFVEESPDD